MNSADVIGRIGFAPPTPKFAPNFGRDFLLQPMFLLGALERLLEEAHAHNEEKIRNWPKFDHSDEAAGAAYVRQDDLITALASLHDIVRKCRLNLEAPAPEAAA